MGKDVLRKTAVNLEHLRRIVVSGIWLALLLVILAGAGWYLMTKSLSPENMPKNTTTEVVVTKPLLPPIPWDEIDAKLIAALNISRKTARLYAETEIDLWTAELMERVDNTFLDWYFSYWTQQTLGLKGLWQHGVHYVIEQQPTASEKLTEEIQAEFSSRVLRPLVAEKILERVVNETAKIYTQTLREEVAEIPQSYTISRVKWRQYLEDIAVTTHDTEGSRQTPLTIKGITASTAGGTLLLAAKMKTLLAKVSSKLLTKSSGKAASAMATKTGGKVAAKIGGKVLGTIAGFGVLAWDIWDHNSTEKVNRPILRAALHDYFEELKYILLDDSEFGIMSTFNTIERQMALQKRN